MVKLYRKNNKCPWRIQKNKESSENVCILNTFLTLISTLYYLA